jgi:hypothetical protein
VDTPNCAFARHQVRAPGTVGCGIELEWRAGPI